MSPTDLRSIRTFPSLVKYLRDELDWPIETEDFDDLTFDYRPEELGIDPKTAARIEEIKQLRPLVSNQPWGIFFIKFEPKRLPVVVLRRILRTLVIKKRASASKSHQATWNLHDLLFISSYGESDHRDITFAHFTEDDQVGDLPALRVLGWDDEDTVLHLEHAHKVLGEKLRWPGDPHQVDQWSEQWSSAFTLRYREVITTSKDLAIQLAHLATAIRKRVSKVISIETESGPLHRLMKSFKKALIHDLYEEAFADMYAQTITYGLLSARVSRPAALVAENITDMVPTTNPFLKELLSTFLTVGGRKGKIDFDELGINEIVQVLREANMEAILRDFGDRNPQEDPVIHFYELFLKEYNPKLRMQRGVFYTPRPVVSFIVRSVDEILRTEFGLEDGLADTTIWGEMLKRLPEVKLPKDTEPKEPFVQILDPALGTGTFLVEVIDIIHKTMTTKWQKVGCSISKQQQLWNEYVPKHLLPRLYGFELLMAPYAIAHMKIGLKLWETGYRFGSDERAHIYLTNSLEPPSDIQSDITDLLPALAQEAQAVNAVKRHKRFTVVIGNPPYARISSNMGEWISGLIEDFKYVDGIHFGEVKHWLHDDYVKFFRLGYLLVEASCHGIVGLITNRGYLSGPTFRGMRCYLWQKSCDLRIVDLHGGAIQEECRPPLNVADENVFDIKQGVAIYIAAVAPLKSHRPLRVYTQLWGTRESKNSVLAGNQQVSEIGIELAANSPRYDFVPKSSQQLDDEYSSFTGTDEIFKLGSTGIQTSRDDYVTDFDREALVQRFVEFCNSNVSNDFLRKQYGLEDGRNWKLADARMKLRKDKDWRRKIVKCHFRPLDYRWMLYHSSVINWPRPEVMPHMLGPNVALVVPRNYQAGYFDAALVSRFITEVKLGESTRGSYCFPLYALSEKDFFESPKTKRSPNISDLILNRLLQPLSLVFITNGQGDLERTLGPEGILAYIYAILYSNEYRKRYSEFIKNGFPRVPLTCTRELFGAFARLGNELVALHLMESPKLDKHLTKFVGKSDNEVAKVRYEDETVWINSVQGFQGVVEDVWNFHIGGYQVCEKWLKDRKGRKLTKDDIEHYQKIVVVLNETIRLMEEIDKVVDQHGGWPGAFITQKPNIE